MGVDYEVWYVVEGWYWYFDVVDVDIVVDMVFGKGWLVFFFEMYCDVFKIVEICDWECWVELGVFVLVDDDMIFVE